MVSSKTVIVQTQYGPVKGCRRSTILGRNYFKFDGIPYMKAPLGKLRFKDAEEPEKWTEPLDATGTRPCYMGINFANQQVHGQEDAATISISTPYLETFGNRKLRVAVYIHGGGFQFSFGTIDCVKPDYLLQKDFIYVTFNYRVGPIGFLSLKDPKLGVPGNAGMKDQVMALKWVKNNIGNFGGDPNNVTIFGTSAGGVSCHLLMMSELAKGLFHRAIPMSGSSFIKTWPFAAKQDLNERLAKAVGWDGSGGEKGILEALENAKAEDIIQAESKLLTQEEIFNEHILFPYTPVIEPYETKNSFLTKDPVLIGKSSWSNDIDCIFGVTSLEGGLMKLYPGLDNYFEIMKQPKSFFPAQEFGESKISEQKISEYGAKIKNLYFNGETPSSSNIYQYYEFAGDIHFGYGIYRSAKSRVNSGGKGKTYIYRFDAQSYLNVTKVIFNLNVDGACHGDDMGYLFTNEFPKEFKQKFVEIESMEFELIKKFTSMITSFIVDGIPTNSDSEFIFEPATKNSFKCLNITNESFEMTPVPEEGRFKVFDEILTKENVQLY